MSAEGENKMTRGQFLRKSLTAGAAGVATLLGIKPEQASAQSHERVMQFDWRTVTMFPPHVPFHIPYLGRSVRGYYSGFSLNLDNPNIKHESGIIKEFYGIKAEDVRRLPGHPHSDRDPYVGHRNRLDESCCNNDDCGPAEVNKVGQTQQGEIIYAYGIMVFGRPTFALSVPTVTEIYDKDRRMGEYPDHGCIFANAPMCLFLSSIS